MDNNLFESLQSSLKEAVAISKGLTRPSRVFAVNGSDIQHIRERAGLTQKELAVLMCVSTRTLQNWEQGRRQPSGPAGALIRIFAKAPGEAIRALQG